MSLRSFAWFSLFVVGCGSSETSAAVPPDARSETMSDSGTAGDGNLGETTPVDASGCTLAANTSTGSVTSPSGCAVLARDTSSCAAARTAQGLSGFWLELSCRVTLTVDGANVRAEGDNRPDYESNYFPGSDPCYEVYSGGIQNPNQIVAKPYAMQLPKTPTTAAQTMRGSAIVGVALNGVVIFGNFAAPGDDIFTEARTFDRCGAHPQMTGVYHYHGEPYSISYDDARFIGVMRDGYPIYGRRDQDGSMPTLDAYGGHTGATAHSATPTYHYHVNEQTSTATGTAGQKQWFLTTGQYRGTPAACTGC